MKWKLGGLRVELKGTWCRHLILGSFYTRYSDPIVQGGLLGTIICAWVMLKKDLTVIPQATDRSSPFM